MGNAYSRFAFKLGYSIARASQAAASLLVDTFTDTNGTLLTAHTPETGGPWAFDTGTIEIQSNHAVALTYGPSANAVASADCGTKNVYGVATFNRSTHIGSACGPITNNNLGGEYYLGWINGGPQIYRADNNALSQKAIGIDIGNGDITAEMQSYNGTIKVRATGDVTSSTVSWTDPGTAHTFDRHGVLFRSSNTSALINDLDFKSSDGTDI